MAIIIEISYKTNALRKQEYPDVRVSREKMFRMNEKSLPELQASSLRAGEAGFRVRIIFDGRARYSPHKAIALVIRPSWTG